MKTSRDKQLLLTTKEVLAILQIHRSTLNRLMEQGAITPEPHPAAKLLKRRRLLFSQENIERAMLFGKSDLQ